MHRLRYCSRSGLTNPNSLSFSLSSLQYLSLADNAVDSLASLACLHSLPALRTVLVAGNPCAAELMTAPPPPPPPPILPPAPPLPLGAPPPPSSGGGSSLGAPPKPPVVFVAQATGPAATPPHVVGLPLELGVLSPIASTAVTPIAGADALAPVWAPPSPLVQPTAGPAATSAGAPSIPLSSISPVPHSPGAKPSLSPTGILRLDLRDPLAEASLANRARARALPALSAGPPRSGRGGRASSPGAVDKTTGGNDIAGPCMRSGTRTSPFGAGGGAVGGPGWSRIDEIVIRLRAAGRGEAGCGGSNVLGSAAEAAALLKHHGGARTTDGTATDTGGGRGPVSVCKPPRSLFPYFHAPCGRNWLWEVPFVVSPLFLSFASHSSGITRRVEAGTTGATKSHCTPLGSPSLAEYDRSVGTRVGA